jgi:glycosyltransferase involved in cell wall biosynthesis
MNTTVKRKILFVITKSNFGGAQRYVYDLATGLPPETYDITVAFGGTGVAGSEQGRLAQMLQDAQIRTLYIPELGRDISLSNDWRALRALIHLCRVERPDILHLNSSKVGGLGALAGRITRVPRIIYTAHGWAFWENRSPIAKVIIYILSWMTVLLSHTTICISAYDRTHIMWMLGCRRRIQVIHNGLSAYILLSRVSARNHLFTPDIQHTHRDDFWLVSTGELHKNKNYLFALETVAAYNATHTKKIFYTIISAGEERERIEQYIAQAQLSTQTYMTGFVPDARTYLKAFDAVYLPSIKEGVPYVLLEAGFASLPVIASRVGGIPEVIVDNSGWLIDPTDIHSAVVALEQIVQNADARFSNAQTLHATVIREYTVANMITLTTSLYT